MLPPFCAPPRMTFFAVSLAEVEVYQTDAQKAHDKYCCLMELGQKRLEKMRE